jgi:hypothetical protein
MLRSGTGGWRPFSTVTVWEARQFEASVRRLDDEGEPLPLLVVSGWGSIQ